MLVIQLILFCALFTLMVKLAVGNNALNGLYFYPRPVQEKVYELGLADRQAVSDRRKRFMILFFAVMLAALVLIIGLWNKVSDFNTAYLQALLFLEVMNWYDGIVIDRLWVGHSRFWIIPGTEEIPFVQTWQQVLRKRSVLSLIWVAGAALVAGSSYCCFEVLFVYDNAKDLSESGRSFQFEYYFFTGSVKCWAEPVSQAITIPCRSM